MSIRLVGLALIGLSLQGQTRSTVPQTATLAAKEESLGASVAQEVQRQTTPLNSQVAQDFVAGVGQRLSPHLPDLGYPFHFSIVTDERSSIHEPLSLPGGYVIVPAGLLLAAQDEAEVAGVLAHAMGHIVVRHSSPRVLVNNASTPLIFMGSWAGQNSALVVPLALRDQLQREEVEADRIAVHTLAAAGYDPEALARYVQRVQPETMRNSLLPAKQTRLQNLAEARQGLAPGNDAAAGQDFASVQAAVRQAVPEVEQAVNAPPRMRRAPSLRHPGEQ